ncbi:DoxX family protein [Rhizobium mesoamericanum]|uniref:Putative transmembrane quinol oxidase subunit n=1 Tax=Rhizobium mesoamericanum STM3625 TaxID=1211777 RepID=K0Q3I3_9HYPH|nr:DoxX family protein [Rhizobium mesoamericanum]CCM78942.1 putative transmembrane quinol oxidase subunit [Rhizobium mesoamericanum STM3625]
MANDIMKLGARILLAILFIVSGFGKVADPAGVAGLLASLHLPAPQLLSYLVGICEIVGAVAIVAGFAVRPISLLLAAWCVATALIVHLQMPLDLMKNLGLAGGFLMLAADGAGSLVIGHLQGTTKA